MEGMPDFAAINAALGLGTETEYSSVGNTNVNEQDIAQLKSIMAAGDPSGVTPKPKSEGAAGKAELPDYMKDFQELLDKKFEKAEDDTTDYGKRAIEELGAGYSHINNRDAFESEIFLRQAQWNYIEEQPNAKPLQDVIEGRYPARFVLSENAKGKLDKDDPNYEEVLKARVDQYFDGEELNPKGKARYAELIASYKSALQGIYYDAQEHANKELVKLNEFKSNLAAELKSYKPGNVEISEEFGAHIANYINSGKSKEWYEKVPATPKEAAQREILMAIMSDPKSLAEWINLLDIRGQHRGHSQKTMQFFNKN